MSIVARPTDPIDQEVASLDFLPPANWFGSREGGSASKRQLRRATAERSTRQASNRQSSGEDDQAARLLYHTWRTATYLAKQNELRQFAIV